MTKPQWVEQHEWFLGEIKATISDRWFFKKLLREYVDKPLASEFRKTIKSLDRELDKIVKHYQKIYCHRPRISAVVKEVEVDDF